MSDDADFITELLQREMDRFERGRARCMPASHIDPRCECCGDEIPEERRRALPHTIHCVDCARVEERKHA